MPTATIDAFRRVALNTQCIFAPIANIEGPPLVCSAATGAADFVRSNAETFFNFCDRCESEPVDGFVFGFGSPSAGSSILELKRTLRTVLQELSKLDSDAADRLQGDLLEEYWRFRCRGVEFFVLTIAPCYSADHARYGFAATETFVLFQPFQSFQRRRPPRQDRMSEAVRVIIRKAYADAGRPYDVSINKGPHEALKIVKPERHGLPPIRWWED